MNDREVVADADSDGDSDSSFSDIVALSVSSSAVSSACPSDNEGEEDDDDALDSVVSLEADDIESGVVCEAAPLPVPLGTTPVSEHSPGSDSSSDSDSDSKNDSKKSSKVVCVNVPPLPPSATPSSTKSSSDSDRNSDSDSDSESLSVPDVEEGTTPTTDTSSTSASNWTKLLGWMSGWLGIRRETPTTPKEDSENSSDSGSEGNNEDNNEGNSEDNSEGKNEDKSDSTSDSDKSSVHLDTVKKLKESLHRVCTMYSIPGEMIPDNDGSPEILGQILLIILQVFMAAPAASPSASFIVPAPAAGLSFSAVPAFAASAPPPPQPPPPPPPPSSQGAGPKTGGYRSPEAVASRALKACFDSLGDTEDNVAKYIADFLRAFDGFAGTPTPPFPPTHTNTYVHGAAETTTALRSCARSRRWWPTWRCAPTTWRRATVS